MQYLKSSTRLQNLSLTSVCIFLNPFLLSSYRLADRIFTEPWVAKTNRLPSTAFSLLFTLLEIRVTEMEMHQILHHKVSWCSVLIAHLYLIFMHNHNNTFFVPHDASLSTQSPFVRAIGFIYLRFFFANRLRQNAISIAFRSRNCLSAA